MKNMKYMMIILAVLALPSFASAAADVKVSISAEIEIIETIDGKDVKKRVEAKDTVSGDTIFYILSFENKGDSDAENIELIDPIPEGTTYVDGSAFGAGTEITFSIDGGKTYKPASLLKYEIDGQKQSVSPEKYDHIRWVIKKLPKGKSGSSGFQVVVK